MRPFRLVIAGAGRVTQSAHLPAAMAIPSVDIAAVVDTTLQRARDVAAAFRADIPAVGSLDEVLDRADGVLIATPNDTHAMLAVKCLERGVSVLVEKPLATTMAECEAMAEAGQRGRATIAVGFCTRFRRNVILLKELLAQGYFGRVFRFVHQFGTVGGWSPESSYNLNRRSTGGGVLVVTGTHFLDRMLHFWGYPRHLTYADDGGDRPESDCIAEFRFGEGPDALVGMVRYSKTTALRGALVLDTEAGVVILDDTDEAEIRLRPKDGQQLEHIIRSVEKSAAGTHPDVFRLQLEDFVAACRNGRPPRIDITQGRASVQLAGELYSSRRPLRAGWYSTTGSETSA